MPETVTPADSLTSGQRDARLLQVATVMGNQPDWRGVCRVLADAVGDIGSALWAALAIHDARRELMVFYPLPTRRNADARTHDPAAIEFPSAQTPLARFGSSDSAVRIDDLASAASSPLHEYMCDFGVGACVAVPLRCHGRLVGMIHFGTSAAQPLDSAAVDYIERLARIAAPAIWNARTLTRLEKGDRRRATLIELSHAINTSLKFDEVIQSACRALRRLEGFQYSAIGLLTDSGETLRAYVQTPDTPETTDGLPDPQVIQAAETPMGFISETSRCYESGDLARGTRFAIERKLLAAGVRHYVAAPMMVRNRVIGGFIFGTTDPHAAQSTDVWLYENIAMQLALAIDNALQYEQLQRASDRLAAQNVYLREEIQSSHNFSEIVGSSAAMRRVFDAIERVATTHATVLILGETGVGKELVARAIHARSNRADQPLVKVNCAAIPEGLIESELFGHERGAFTSATARRIGRFELARDGTLFFDEIGELPLSVQAKLLRVLQDGEFERVGGTQTLHSNARIIAATNRDLLAASEARTFRPDLFYRLNVFPIHVPSLAERREDIPLLVEYFINRLNRRMGKRVASIDRESLDYLCCRQWLGNVRELEHVIERAMIICDGSCLKIDARDVGVERAQVARPPSAVAHGAQPPPAVTPSPSQGEGWGEGEAAQPPPAVTPSPSQGEGWGEGEPAQPPPAVPITRPPPHAPALQPAAATYFPPTDSDQPAHGVSVQAPRGEPAPPFAIRPSEPAASRVAPGTTAQTVATLEEMERRHIQEALQAAAGVIEGPRGAAAMLGLKPSTLRFRMKRLGVTRPK